MTGAGRDGASVQNVTAAIHRVLPDLEAFNLTVEAAHGLTVTASDVWLPVAYGLGYVAILLAGAVTLFERRDFR